jgi:hypothetical protein
LKRSKSLPFFNSWEYGNIDVDLQLDGIGKWSLFDCRIYYMFYHKLRMLEFCSLFER